VNQKMGIRLRPMRGPNGPTSTYLISQFYMIPVGFTPRVCGGLAMGKKHGGDVAVHPTGVWGFGLIKVGEEL